MTSIFTEQPHRSIFTIYHGEDLSETLPQFLNQFTGDPFDFTNVDIDWIARPSFNHATRFLRLTSVGSNGIYKDDADDGLISFFYPQAAVEAALPASGPDGWDQFMRFTFTDGFLGEVTRIFSIGPLYVFPARDAA